MDKIKYVTVVKERRKLVDADVWVCERCGQTSEDGLCVVTTGRCTRSDPHGQRELYMCSSCFEGTGNKGHTPSLYGRVVMT